MHFKWLNISLLALLTCSAAQASSIHLGIGAGGQSLYVDEHQISLTPIGTNLLASFDLTDSWSVSADYAHYENNNDIANVADINYHWQSIGMAASYQFSHGYAYYQISEYEDKQRNRNLAANYRQLSSNGESTGHSLGYTYQQTVKQWQIGVSTAYHYSDWSQISETLPPSDNLDGPPDIIVEDGDSQFISVGASAAYLMPLENERYITFGSSLNWNLLLNSDSTTAQMQPSRRNDRRDPVQQRVIGGSATGAESYGQLSIYLSLDLSQKWSLDLDSYFDVATDDNQNAYYVTLSYYF